MSKNKPKMLFAKPKDRKDLSQAANHMLQLGAIAGRLANEKRSFVDHKDGRAENVAEHTHMLTRIAPIIAQELYPELDTGLVSRFATVHDDLEAYVGDTPTHRLTKEITAQKESIEAYGLEQLRIEYSTIPSYLALVEEYEEQKRAEARFVRVLDKCMPLVVHFNQGGITLRGHWKSHEMTNNASSKAHDLLRDYPEYKELVAIRNELTRQAAAELFK